MRKVDDDTFLLPLPLLFFHLFEEAALNEAPVRKRNARHAVSRLKRDQP